MPIQLLFVVHSFYCCTRIVVSSTVVVAVCVVVLWLVRIYGSLGF